MVVQFARAFTSHAKVRKSPFFTDLSCEKQVVKYQLQIAQQSFTGPQILPLKWMPLVTAGVTQVTLTMCKELGARTAKLTLLLVNIMKLHK